MNLSVRAKAILAVVLLVGFFVWVVLLDYGINAGRIHYGVNVHGVDVGGMTLEEAMDVLQERGEELRYEPVLFSAEGMECEFIPDELGWGPKPKSTAEEARDVGYEGGVVDSLRERAQAWLGGVRIDWAGKPFHGKVSALIDDCEEQATALGLELNRYKLRRKIARAIVTWPRKVFSVPVEPAS